jgi:GNAT superfamily N-acetyltransferase
MEIIEVKEGDYIVSTDKSKLDAQAIQDFLANESYWAQNIPVSVVKKTLEGSLCFGVYHEDKQIGFARVVTDKVAFAYLADVYILVPHRGKGLSKFLMRTIMAHPDLQGLRRWMLATTDAHQLYRQFGFTDITNPEKFMQIHNPGVYTK